MMMMIFVEKEFVHRQELRVVYSTLSGCWLPGDNGYRK